MPRPGSLTPARLGAFAPAAILGITWLVWIGSNGAYFPDAWYPSAAGAAALLLLTVGAGGQVLPTVRPARVALLAFAALVGLNFLSILWAAEPGHALQAANKLLLYLAVAWTFAILPWTPRSLGLALGAFSLGIAAFCAIGLLRATSASNLTSFFDELRYATPLHYPNATAALAAMGAWPALIFSARRELSGAIRIALFPIAVFLLEFAFLPQSRGALVGVVVTAPLALAFSADRVSLLVRMGIVGGGLAVTIPRTVSVDNAVSSGGHVLPVLQHAANGMLETTLAALALSALLVLAEARLRSSDAAGVRLRWRPGRRGRLALVLAATAAVVGAVVAVEPTLAHIVRTVYRSGRTDASTGSTRLFSATPEERFDYVRVAVLAFRGAPLVGVGAGNFAAKYDALRHFPKHSLYAHDLPLRVLSETGLLGIALFATMLGALVVGLLSAGRGSGAGRRAVVTAVFIVTTFFLVHASLDWMDEFPALAAPALAFSLAAIGMRKVGVGGKPAGRGRALRVRSRPLRPKLAMLGWVSGMLTIAVALVLALGAPYLATRYIERGLASFKARPSSAYHDFARAADIDPLSADPLISEGTVAVNLGDSTRARTAFERAIQREDQWYPHLELALLDAQASQFEPAMRQLERAQALDANDPVLTQAKTLIAQRRQIDPGAFNSLLLQGAEADVFRHINIK